MCVCVCLHLCLFVWLCMYSSCLTVCGYVYVCIVSLLSVRVCVHRHQSACVRLCACVCVFLRVARPQTEGLLISSESLTHSSSNTRYIQSVVQSFSDPICHSAVTEPDSLRHRHSVSQFIQSHSLPFCSY